MAPSFSIEFLEFSLINPCCLKIFVGFYDAFVFAAVEFHVVMKKQQGFRRVLANPCCFEISAEGDFRYTTITKQQGFTRVLPNPCCFENPAEGVFRYATIISKQQGFTRVLTNPCCFEKFGRRRF